MSYSINNILNYTLEDLDKFLSQFPTDPSIYLTLGEKRYMTVYYLHQHNLVDPNDMIYIQNPSFQQEILKDDFNFENFKKIEMSEFHNFLKFLGDNGTMCSKMTRTKQVSVRDLLEFFTNGHLSDVCYGHSCFNVGPFITALFSEEYKIPNKSLTHVRDDDFYYRGNTLETYREFLTNFRDMKLFWFHLTSHECNLIRISKDEIYFIDYYMETERPKLFRIVKFTTMTECLTIIKKVMFDKDEETYKNLFDFKNDTYKNTYEYGVSFEVYDILRLPTMNKLINMWNHSLPLYLRDIKDIKEKLPNYNLIDVELSDYKGYENFERLFYENLNILQGFYQSYTNTDYKII